VEKRDEQAKAPKVIFQQSLLTSHFSRLWLNIWLRFGQADDFLAFLPLTALFQKLDPFEAL
jgi:hypothetical protein